MGTSTRRTDAARLFSGTKSYFNDTSSAIRGVHAQFPASYPKYAQDNSINGTLETGFRLYLPVPELLKSNPKDADILKPLVNNKYIEMIVTQVNHGFGERMEVKRLVNGAFATYYFGIQPPEVTFSGYLLNDAIDDWHNKFLRLYTRYLRGTQLSKLGRLVSASYSDIVVSGECKMLNTGIGGNSETYTTFQMSMIAHRMTVRRSPIVSDFVTKEQNKLTDATQPNQVLTKRPMTVIRGSGSSDVVTQRSYSPAEIQKRLDALENQRQALQANKVANETRLTLAQQALTTYQQSNPTNPFDANGLSLQSAVRVAQNDLTAVNRAISEVTKQQKQLKEGIAQRDSKLERKRSAKSTVPSRVIEVSPRTQPKINAGITQRF